ncbi:hypothetical protein QQS45_08375 [Alteriqipengyuania flavescens]|uniref:hypothetical protein n=1 Tax=Alteriqipengyuania flavescens TaxID=3053610 RepID=UPI0025B37A09|nr:hypothetical protein [Alteriqipengyuania flavescens]WJY17662.1 hypothetical protein QQW98_08370 [Alteriqipengyuania flavescens]WJY23605.1 hypothetical protein QQS45_08375 [Alteriqipengyuania flavescens]
MNYLSLALKIGPWVAVAILAMFLSDAMGDKRDLRASLETRTEERNAAREMLGLYAEAVSSRDDTIRRQNDSIHAIRTAAAAARQRYEAGLAQAEARAATHKSRADALLALQPPEGELEQCRAARQLLEDELVP